MEEKITAKNSFFLIPKNDLTVNLKVNVELYYEEHEKGVFEEKVEKIQCWSEDLILPNLKGIYKLLIKSGLILTGFTYEGEYIELTKLYKIRDIKLSPKNFEGEEMFHGDFYNVNGELSSEVYFYVEYYLDDVLITVLWDDENDALQYDPKKEVFLWDVCEGSHIKGPIENFTFKLLGS